MNIDLNSDLGEGFGAWRLGDDPAMLELVSSANIACGFHAGDPSIMIATCRTAAERGVIVGAHVGYRDLAGFGRRALAMDAEDLYADVVYQLGALSAAATVAGTAVRYVKPHGALYNVAFSNHDQAAAVVRAISDVDPHLAILALPGSALLSEGAVLGLRCVTEAFADRGYRADGTLLPRGQTGAVLSDPVEIAERILRLVQDSVVDAVDGSTLTMNCESVCVHGDTPGAVEIARAIRRKLIDTGNGIQPFIASKLAPA